VVQQQHFTPGGGWLCSAHQHARIRSAGGLAAPLQLRGGSIRGPGCGQLEQLLQAGAQLISPHPSAIPRRTCTHGGALARLQARPAQARGPGEGPGPGPGPPAEPGPCAESVVQSNGGASQPDGGASHQHPTSAAQPSGGDGSRTAAAQTAQLGNMASGRSGGGGCSSAVAGTSQPSAPPLGAPSAVARVLARHGLAGAFRWLPQHHIGEDLSCAQIPLFYWCCAPALGYLQASVGVLSTGCKVLPAAPAHRRHLPAATCRPPPPARRRRHQPIVTVLLLTSRPCPAACTAEPCLASVSGAAAALGVPPSHVVKSVAAYAGQPQHPAPPHQQHQQQPLVLVMRGDQRIDLRQARGAWRGLDGAPWGPGPVGRQPMESADPVARLAYAPPLLRPACHPGAGALPSCLAAVPMPVAASPAPAAAPAAGAARRQDRPAVALRTVAVSASHAPMCARAAAPPWPPSPTAFLPSHIHRLTTPAALHHAACH